MFWNKNTCKKVIKQPDVEAETSTTKKGIDMSQFMRQRHLSSLNLWRNVCTISYM